MATLDYNLGTPLGPDPRAVSDLEAIDTYVRTQARLKVKEYPKSLALVEDYERWRQGLGYWSLMIMVNDTMRAAKAKRDAINVAQGSAFPSDTIVEPGAFVTSPPMPRGKAWWLAAGLVAGIAGGGYAVIKLGKAVSPTRLLKGT
jgi:hypothetical protein